jgi:multidrug resistance efflux pump
LRAAIGCKLPSGAASLNTPLKEGDVLFRIDPTPYQYVVDEKKAALADAEGQ